MFILVILSLLLTSPDTFCSTAERVAVEAGVKTEVAKDLALPWNPLPELDGRVCLDGRPVKDFQGEIVEYWANLECPYCGIQEPLAAQRQNPDICIIARHIPSREYGESLKKALSYEALKSFSVNAANLFWDKVVPKTNLALPMPYEGSLLASFQEAAVTPEAFTEALKNASELVNQDIDAAVTRITMTPTWVMAGIRFSACDFTAAQMREPHELAKKARAGDEDAKARIITIITNGHLNETML
jgi:hypothetical protein